MDSIPTEILYEILSYIPEKDIPSARLVNRFFNKVANERYFRTICIPFGEFALSKLQYVSGRPELAQCVRHLDYYPLMLLYPISFWKGKELQRAGEFEKALGFALSKMPNVREITANWYGIKSRKAGGWPETSILVGDVNVYARESVLPDPAEKEKLLGPLKELMVAASQAQNRLDKLSITPLWRGIFAEGPELLLNSELLFQNLTSLSVYFSTNRTQEDFDALRKDVKEGRIFRFLSSAPKLRSLAVGFHWQPRYHSAVSVMPLLQIFGDNYVWKYLEVFLFNGRQLHGEDLTQFFGRHASTLKTFGLYRPYLGTGTWRAVLDSIKGHPELCLEKLVLIDPSEESAEGRIRNYWSQSDRAKMNGYILRGGPPYPLTKEELEQKIIQSENVELGL
ncbi:hypothetical protein RUND412_004271 [Rhizina undulata]